MSAPSRPTRRPVARPDVHDGAPQPTGAPTPAWRLLLARVLWVTTSSLVAIGGLVFLLAWIALRIDWQIPDQGALSGPTVIESADGTELARFDTEVDRRVVALEDISQQAQDAIVAAEDARFYEHDGVDPLSLLRAVVVNVRTGGITQGGSTLTQQYVKNAFTGADRTVERKVREAVISIALERRLSKQQILERYINQVYFGEGAYGIEAAALTYFGVSAARLDVAQAATLAQLLPAPSRWNPRADPAGTAARRDRVIDRMWDLGMISAAQARDARATELEVEPRQQRQTRVPFFVEFVRKQLAATYGEREVLTGALRVRTTLDLQAQEELETAVAAQLPPQPDRPGVDAGAIAVDPRTGRILALYGGRDFETSQFDLATQAHRRPGSAFKPIAYLAALEAGISPGAVYNAPASFRRGQLCDPGWGPANAGGGGFGRLPLREGLVSSVNTVFAQVGCDVGGEAIAGMAVRLGVRSDPRPTPQIAIGGVDTNSTVLDLVAAYATIANDGVTCPVTAVLEVRDQDGRRLETQPGGDRAPTEQMLEDRPPEWAEDDTSGCWRVVDADDVRRTTSALQDVVARTTGRRAQIDRPQAGKTGTTDEEVDAWFAGYTPDLALVVRVGDADEVPLTDIEGFRRVQGGTIPALIWKDAAEDILAEVPPRDFPLPGDDGEGVVGPARRRPTQAPSPSPTATTPPTTAPTDEPSPQPTPTETDSEDESDGPGGGGGCIPILQDCSP